VCYGNLKNATFANKSEYSFTSWSERDNLSDLNVKNNIGYAAEPFAYCIYIDDNTVGNSNISITNNCWYKSSGNWYYYDTGTGNALSTWNDYSEIGTDVNLDPKFTNIGNNDYSLQIYPPCINAGTDVGLTQDYDGNPVPYGWEADIGAYEYLGNLDHLDAEINASHTSGWVLFQGARAGVLNHIVIIGILEMVNLQVNRTHYTHILLPVITPLLLL